MVRGALKALLAMEGDIEIVAETDRADQILALASQTKPDVALLDIEMPGGDGISAAGQLSRALPACRTLILTTFGRPGFLRRAMESGAAGFMLKDAPAHELALAIRRTMAGQRVGDPSLAAAPPSAGGSPFSELAREVPVARLGGGEITEYTELLEDARRHAVDRMIKNATAMGANAVIRMQYDSSEIGNTMSEIVAYGTAAVIEPSRS